MNSFNYLEEKIKNRISTSYNSEDEKLPNYIHFQTQ